jgi:hypothetical protein
MALYEDWAYKLCPIPFDEFINQAEKLCGTMVAKDYLKRLEDGDAVFSVDKQDDPDFMVPDENTEPNIMPSINNNSAPIVPSQMISTSNGLTAEQLERIEVNKQKALEKKRQREQEAPKQPTTEPSESLDVDGPLPFDDDIDFE